MKANVLILLLLLVTGWAVAKEQSAGELLDEILEKPGSWTQMCVGVAYTNQYYIQTQGITRLHTMDRVSKENLQRLRNRRIEVLGELSRRLMRAKTTAVRWVQADMAYAGDTTCVDISEETFEAGKSLELYFALLQDLNGIESLSALLNVERSMNHFVDYAAFSSTKTGGANLMHAECLGTISAILRQEKAAGSERLEDGMVYSKESRDLVVGTATNYLRQTKPSDFKASKGMGPVPYHL